MEKLTKDEAERLLEEWADIVELDTDRDLFTSLVEELRMPVRLNKLTFDEETETFKLVLKTKLENTSIVEIKSVSLGAKRDLQKFKDNESVDQARFMISAYTGLKQSEVRELKDIDINRINAIVLGFINQSDPKKG